eukprot:768318-Hanusia_phi.AAC.1
MTRRRELTERFLAADLDLDLLSSIPHGAVSDTALRLRDRQRDASTLVDGAAGKFGCSAAPRARTVSAGDRFGQTARAKVPNRAGSRSRRVCRAEHASRTGDGHDGTHRAVMTRGTRQAGGREVKLCVRAASTLLATRGRAAVVAWPALQASGLAGFVLEVARGARQAILIHCGIDGGGLADRTREAASRGEVLPETAHRSFAELTGPPRVAADAFPGLTKLMTSSACVMSMTHFSRFPMVVAVHGILIIEDITYPTAELTAPLAVSSELRVERVAQLSIERALQTQGVVHRWLLRHCLGLVPCSRRYEDRVSSADLNGLARRGGWGGVEGCRALGDDHVVRVDVQGKRLLLLRRDVHVERHPLPERSLQASTELRERMVSLQIAAVQHDAVSSGKMVRHALGLEVPSRLGLAVLDDLSLIQASMEEVEELVE